MTTSFHVSHDGKVYELFAERVSETDALETWRVAGRDDVNRFIIVTNNRPELQAKKQYKTFYKWTVIEGDYGYQRIRDLITNQLEYYIRGLWKPPTKGVNEKKAAAAKLQGKLF